MKNSLKQVRIRAGLGQADIAAKLQKSIPLVCNYENGIMLPDLEDMICLERSFEQKIEWSDNIPEDKKREILDNLMNLSEYYPLSAVLSFGLRSIKEGIKSGDPGQFIRHFAEVSEDLNIEPLKY
jgi:transcriptional regulator with XRE-family HTH domain